MRNACSRLLWAQPSWWATSSALWIVNNHVAHSLSCGSLSCGSLFLANKLAITVNISWLALVAPVIEHEWTSTTRSLNGLLCEGPCCSNPDSCSGSWFSQAGWVNAFSGPRSPSLCSPYWLSKPHSGRACDYVHREIMRTIQRAWPGWKLLLWIPVWIHAARTSLLTLSSWAWQCLKP